MDPLLVIAIAFAVGAILGGLGCYLGMVVYYWRESGRWVW